jgi:rsbT co-antagonist protein RsbR
MNTGGILDDVQSIRAANERLHQRIFELEQELALTQQREQELQERETRLQFIVEGSRDGAWDWHLRTNEAFLSDRYREMLGYRPDELENSVDTWVSNIHPDDLPDVQRVLNDYLEGRIHTYEIEHRIRHKSGEWRWMLSRGKVTLRDEDGKPLRMTGVISDLTERKQAEEERMALQQQVIAAQQEALRELSTPLIPLSKRAIMMPLIGTIDSQRAQQVLEALLEGVSQHQADMALLDITGVQVVDTQVANALIRAAQAVKLLGAQVVLTGIQPRIAQTLVQLGVDLGGIITRGTLQAGIAYALTKQ